MSLDPTVLGIVVAALLVLNLFVLILIRSTLRKIAHGIAGTQSDAASGTEDDKEQAGSPLQDAFKQYSTLTLRMADLVFRLVGNKGGDAADANQSDANQSAARDQTNQMVSALLADVQPKAAPGDPPAEL